MSPNDKRVKLSRSTRMRESDKRATSMALPLAVHRRLDILAEAAKDVSATRAELVAMLIAEADIDSGSLEQRILAYRKKTVAEVLAVPVGDSDVVVPLRTPGRPSSA